MKIANKIFVITIIFILMFGMSYSQNEYRKAGINISVPSIVESEKKTHHFETGKVTTDTTKKKTYVGIHVRLDDMQLNGNHFSGIKVTTYPVSEEIISFRGVFSDDKQKIESISIDLQYVKYNLPDRSKAHIEEKKTIKFTFENIPMKLGGYSFDHEATVISNAEYIQYRYLKYRAISETTISKMIAVDEERITKYTQCFRVSLRPTNYTAKKSDRDKVAVITAGCDVKGGERIKECGPIIGIFAKLTFEFSQTPGLTALAKEFLEEILQEQELSKSGLVSPDSKVRSGRMLEEDILVIIQLQERTPTDPPETFYYKLLVEDKQSGELVDTGISYRFSNDQPFIDHFVKRAYAHVMKNYF